MDSNNISCELWWIHLVEKIINLNFEVESDWWLKTLILKLILFSDKGIYTQIFYKTSPFCIQIWSKTAICEIGVLIKIRNILVETFTQQRLLYKDLRINSTALLYSQQVQCVQWTVNSEQWTTVVNSLQSMTQLQLSESDCCCWVKTVGMDTWSVSSIITTSTSSLVWLVNAENWVLRGKPPHPAVIVWRAEISLNLLLRIASREVTH